jgi:hypothetical protein
MNFARIAVASTFLVLGVACAADKPATDAAEKAAPAPAAAKSGGAGEGLALPGARVDQPEGWAFRAPSSSMRLAEAEIPGPGGPALLTVFFFGAGGGGGIDANLQRWAGQIEADPDSETLRDSFTVRDYTVSTIGVAGTLLPSRMGGGPTEPTPGSRLLGAVIEGPGGPWFFKMTGPAETVLAAAPAFDGMLRSISP